MFIDALHNSIIQFISLATFTNSNFRPWVLRDFKELVLLKIKHILHPSIRLTFSAIKFSSGFRIDANVNLENSTRIFLKILNSHSPITLINSEIMFIIVILLVLFPR